MKQITELTYNWFSTTDREYFDRIIVGKKMDSGIVCTKIEEHRAAGEGDRCWFDAHYNDESTLRIYNPNTVTYQLQS
jgi:hypothetical protein